MKMNKQFLALAVAALLTAGAMQAATVEIKNDTPTNLPLGFLPEGNDQAPTSYQSIAPNQSANVTYDEGALRVDLYINGQMLSSLLNRTSATVAPKSIAINDNTRDAQYPYTADVRYSSTKNPTETWRYELATNKWVK